jgi:hypothetical protein
MTRIVRNPRVIWDLVDGAMKLCDLDSGEFYDLNDTGAVIWAVCEDSHEAILARMREKYPGQPADAIDAAVRDFLQALESKGLISLHDEQTGTHDVGAHH